MQKFTKPNAVTASFPSLYGEKRYGQYLRYKKLFCRFCKVYAEKACYFCSSSGRVEIVGNHTDHNGGKVLACAVSLDIVAAFVPTDDNKVTIKSFGCPDIVADLSDLSIVGGSVGLVKGVAKYFCDERYAVGGFKAYTTSNVPSGGGLSSSAAFELLVAAIFNDVYNKGKVTPETMARAGQYAENDYFGKPCGLMDQSAVAFGGIIELDYADGLKTRRLDAGLDGADLVVVNSGGSHAGLTDLYAAIPTEMKAVAHFFGKERLCEIDEKDFLARENDVQKALGKRPVLRAEHFYEENERVSLAADCLEKANYPLFIKQVSLSGESSLTKLQNCRIEGAKQQLLCDALDYAKEVCPQAGVRVHGGGFAGTTLNVVPTAKTKQFVKAMSKKFGASNVYVLKVRTVGAKVL